MSDLLQKAIDELNKLPADQQDVIAAWILERLASEDDESEEEWEARVVTEALGDALLPDGSIDFDTLDSRTEVTTLDGLYLEGETEDAI